MKTFLNNLIQNLIKMKNAIISYKTTFFGLVAAFCFAYQQDILSCLTSGNIDLHCIKTLLVSFAIFAVGYFAKDANVSGTAKTVLLFMFLSFGFSTNISAQNSLLPNVYVPAAGNNGNILVNWNGVIGAYEGTYVDTGITYISTKDTLNGNRKTAAIYTKQIGGMQAGIFTTDSATGDTGRIAVSSSQITLKTNKATLQIDSTGVKFNNSNFGSANVDSVYLPNFSAIANITTGGGDSLSYSVNGNTVHVYGIIGIQATAAATVTKANISLPTTANFNLQRKCIGFGVRNVAIGATPNTANIVWDGLNQDQAQFTFYSDVSDTGAIIYYLIDFTYTKN